MILVVDDSRLMRTMLCALLERVGAYNIIPLESGAHLLDFLAEPSLRPQVKLILIDLMMPDLNGIQTIAIIRTWFEMQETPIIMITADSDIASLSAAFETGASDFIRKPPEEVEFLARVRGALRLSQLLEQRNQREQELAELKNQLERISNQDALTGIANRRYFNECVRQLEPNTPFALILLDIDHFKTYNDHFGHPQGDDCLREVAQFVCD